MIWEGGGGGDPHKLNHSNKYGRGGDRDATSKRWNRTRINSNYHEHVRVRVCVFACVREHVCVKCVKCVCEVCVRVYETEGEVTAGLVQECESEA